MRNLLLGVLIVPALLASPAASAFDPDTPVDARKAAFPVVLVDEEDSSIDLAFQVAFGLSKGAEASATREIDGRSYNFRPAAIRLLWNNVVVLLSLGSLEDAGHGDGGINAIHYLRATPEGWQIMHETLGLGAVGTVGNAATSWGFSDAIGENNYLVTAGGGVWQGCLISSATLTELTPGGPVDRGSFTDAMSSGAGLGQKEQDYDGKIVAAEPDKSFTVAYTGSKAFKQRYVLKDGKYALVGADRVPGC